MISNLYVASYYLEWVSQFFVLVGVLVKKAAALDQYLFGLNQIDEDIAGLVRFLVEATEV